MRLSFLGLFLGLLSFVSALSVTGNSLLVILDDESDKPKYSQFWTDLEDRGFHLTYQTPKSPNLNLFLHGEPAYSHLIVLPSKSKGLGPALTPNLLVDFVNKGSNILLTQSAEYNIPSTINSLLSELDISLPADKNSIAVDHFNYDTKSAGDKHDVLLVPSPDFGDRPIKNFFSVDGLIALPRAVGHVLGNASPLLASVLRAPSTAYVYNPKEEADEVEDPFATGNQIGLVSTFTARNSARFTVLGSAEALQDAWFTASVQPTSAKEASKSANRAFAAALSAWTFQELGVLRVNSVAHHQTDIPGPEDSGSDLESHTGESANIYRINSPLRYSASISEWVNDHWAPFTLPPTDQLQLECSMLSPFHRLNLAPSTSVESDNATVFTTDFQLPDQHGIFNLLLPYRRPFMTFVEEKRTITVRHNAHDEWPRSFVISGAWPWIGGVWMTIAGWVVFVFGWMYCRPVQEQAAGKR